MNQPDLGQPGASDATAGNPAPGVFESAGFILIEQMLREKVAGSESKASELIDAPLKHLADVADSAVNPKLKYQADVVSAGFEKCRDLLNILANSNKT